ncbi:MAG: hypothetical protein ABL986_10975 [Vicinamibacterales bacterium]
MSVTMGTMGELDASEVGVSGRLSWHATRLFGVEGEVAFYPGGIPDRRVVTSSRTEAVFGITVGPRVGRIRPLARLRPGVLRIAPAPGPVACILIYPPPLTCTLASGRTLFMLDVGGGVEVDLTPSVFVRLDAGDRVVRYPGPAITRDGVMTDETFIGHDLRLAAGVGWRLP